MTMLAEQTQYLASLPYRTVYKDQHRAVMRLILRMYAETHRIFRQTFGYIRAQIDGATDTEGMVDGGALLQRLPIVEQRFRSDLHAWIDMFERARSEAAGIAYGGLVVQHNRYMAGFDESLTEDALADRVAAAVASAQARGTTADQVSAMARLWEDRRQRALHAAATRVHGDGLTLSSRIWRLEDNGLSQIRNTLLTAYAERTSAVGLSRLLEPVLGAGQNCPRWAYHRLYGMTASERAASSDGLLRDDECQATGISYNALRLARTEIQNANHAMASDIYQHAPWIEGKYVRLSPSHPRSDVCDTWAAGGPYESNEQILSLHPNCVTPGQLVQTEKGSVPIEQIRTGGKVLTHWGRYREVTLAWSRECDETVYRIETDRGHFELTGDHPVLTSRGWVEAKSLQIGDQVLHASVNTISNLGLVVSEDAPALFAEPSITAGVSIGVPGMPAAPIALDSNLNRDQSEVNVVPTDTSLSFVGNTGAVERFQHGVFKLGGIGKSDFLVSFKHGHKAGVAFALSLGNFLANIWSLGGVVVASKINSLHRFLHRLASNLGIGPIIVGPASFMGFTRNLSAGSIVSVPGSSRGFAPTLHGDAAHFQEGAQHAIGESVALCDFGSNEVLVDVDVFQQIFDGVSVFGFKAECVPLWDCQAVGSAVGVIDASELSAANGASNHDNLLSLSPDDRVGHGSGSPPVDGLITPIQALMNYTTIRRIVKRRYQGLVYNMEVDEDNSYTVNGAVVHNCLCYYEPALMNTSDFRRGVRGWLNGENQFLDEYETWLGASPVNGLPWVTGLAQTLELWLSTSAGGQAAALGL